MYISKEFNWEMGHRLVDHPGKCRNVHGHSYRLTVEVEGQPDENGMIVDFYVISSAVKPLIEKLDHAFLCHDQDTELLMYLKRNDMKHEVISFPSTVENLCGMFAEALDPMLRPHENIEGFEVRINETESSEAVLAVSF